MVGHHRTERVSFDIQDKQPLEEDSSFRRFAFHVQVAETLPLPLMKTPEAKVSIPRKGPETRR